MHPPLGLVQGAVKFKVHPPLGLVQGLVKFKVHPPWGWSRGWSSSRCTPHGDGPVVGPGVGVPPYEVSSGVSREFTQSVDGVSIQHGGSCHGVTTDASLSSNQVFVPPFADCSLSQGDSNHIANNNSNSNFSSNQARSQESEVIKEDEATIQEEVCNIGQVQGIKYHPTTSRRC